MKHLHCTRVCGGHQGYKDEWDSQRGWAAPVTLKHFWVLSFSFKRTKAQYAIQFQAELLQIETGCVWRGRAWQGGWALLQWDIWGSSMASQSMFENIGMDGGSGASVTEMQGFCDSDTKLIMKEGGLWGIKDEETVQISECPPWRMLIGFLGSQEFVCRQETIVMYICYSACILYRIKLLPLVLLYF